MPVLRKNSAGSVWEAVTLGGKPKRLSSQKACPNSPMMYLPEAWT
jgi:hypothetical protein